jgi:hypothetical protein
MAAHLPIKVNLLYDSPASCTSPYLISLKKITAATTQTSAKRESSNVKFFFSMSPKIFWRARRATFPHYQAVLGD